MTSGTLKASHVRTDLAALVQESMSSTPASMARLVADDADALAAEAGEATR
ncbi:MAG: hypothetical protein R2716_08280 [Microthrixaceae bacterium]